MKIYKKSMAFQYDIEALKQELEKKITLLREKGRMRDTSAIEGVRSGVMSSDYKTRMLIKDIDSIIGVTNIPYEDLPMDIQDWLGVNGEKGKIRIGQMFDPDGNRI